MSTEVKFAKGKNGVLHRPVNQVSVDIKMRGKLVILTELFELRKRVRHESGVNDSNVCRGFSVGTESTRLRGRRRVIENLVHLVQTESRTRPINVPLDVFGFEGSSAGVNLESLHDPRVDTADNDGGNDEHGATEDGETPAPDECGHQKKQRNEHGNARENLVSGNCCGGLGESGSRCEKALRGRHQSGVLIDPEVCRLNQHVQCAKNRDLGAERL